MKIQLRSVPAVFVLVACAGHATAQTCQPDWWVASNGISSLGGITVPLDFCEYDPDGPGPMSREFFTTGLLRYVDGFETSFSVAKWDGLKWSGTTTGIGSSSLEYGYALDVWDPDGSGTAKQVLCCGGVFFTAGGEPVVGIAAWNGAAWSAIDPNFDGIVFDVCTNDFDGPGPRQAELVVAGNFRYAGALEVNSLARWDGTYWRAMGGLPGTTHENGYSRFTDVHSFDPDGPGPSRPVLWVQSTDFSKPPMRFDGAGLVATSSFGGSSFSGSFSRWGDTIADADFDGSGAMPRRLFVVANGIYRWSGTFWMLITPEWPTDGQIVPTLTVLLRSVDLDGPGPQNEVLFASVGRRIFVYNGTTLIEIQSPPNFMTGSNIYSLGGFDPDGSGPLTTSIFVGNEGSPVSLGLARYGCAIDWGRCFGDTDQNFNVGFLDITTVLSHWGSHVSPVVDTNNDGVVGMTDITGVLSNFGTVCAAASTADPGTAPPPNVHELTNRLMRWSQPPRIDRPIEVDVR